MYIAIIAIKSSHAEDVMCMPQDIPASARSDAVNLPSAPNPPVMIAEAKRIAANELGGPASQAEVNNGNVQVAVLFLQDFFSKIARGIWD